MVEWLGRSEGTAALGFGSSRVTGQLFISCLPLSPSCQEGEQYSLLLPYSVAVRLE